MYTKHKKSNRPLSSREVQLKKNIMKSVKRLPEPKNHYSHAVVTTCSFTGNILNLSDMAQGDTAQTREGDRCTITNISVRGRAISNSTLNEYNALRVILFYWKHDTGERAPVPSDVLQATYLGDARAPYAPVVVGEEAKAIQIISDRTYDLNIQSNACQSFHINKKVNKKLFYNDNITSGRNQLHILFISDDGLSAWPAFQFVSNVTFRDI